MEYIETHPDEWVQRSYRCGTAACFAGHAALLAGGEWETPAEDEGAHRMVAVSDDPERRAWDGRTIHVVFRAERVLGISRSVSEELFRGTNTLDDLRRIVGEIIAERRGDTMSRKDPAHVARNAEIVKRVRAGEVRAQIGREYGLSGTRISAIYNAAEDDRWFEDRLPKEEP
jgi:hypothetical protein